MPDAQFETRILPVNEWHRLPSYIPHEVFDEEYTIVIVIERNGIIVGSWSLMPYYHAECCWIAEEHQSNPVIAKRLLIAMQEAANEVGARSVITASDSDRVTKILKKLKATELPGKHYVIHFGS